MKVFIIGVSHFKYFPGCSLSKFKKWETPLGTLEVDEKSIFNLKMILLV